MFTNENDAIDRFQTNSETVIVNFNSKTNQKTYRDSDEDQKFDLHHYLYIKGKRVKEK